MRNISVIQISNMVYNVKFGGASGKIDPKKGM